MDFEEEFRASMDRVIEFYGCNGVEFGEPATFTCLPMPRYKAENTLLEVPQAESFCLTRNTSFLTSIAEPLIADFYKKRGLNVSVKALRQYLELQISQVKDFTGEGHYQITENNSYGTEILVYPLCQATFFQNPIDDARMFLDQIMAHELWHVFEYRYGIISKNYALEGTAEFACTVFKHSQPSYEVRVPHYDQTYVMDVSRYESELAIVQKHVYTLRDLLSDERHNAVANEWKTQIHEKILVAFSEEPTNKNKKRMLGMYQHFSHLDQDFTQTGLIRTFARSGYVHLASELVNQDCRKLLDYYQQLGFGPNHTLPCSPCLRVLQNA